MNSLQGGALRIPLLVLVLLMVTLGEGWFIEEIIGRTGSRLLKPGQENRF